MLWTRPRVAEINKHTLDFIVLCNYFINLLYIVVYKQKICNIGVCFALVLENFNNVSSADAEHINFNVNRNNIFIRILTANCPANPPLPQPYFKVKRKSVVKSFVPFACVFFRIFYKKIANRKFRLCPFFLSDSHNVKLCT